MPPPNTLGMRNPQPIGQKPFNPWKAVDENTINKLDEEKLKSPTPLQIPSEFSKVPQYTYHVSPHQEVFEAIRNRLTGFYPPILLEEHIVNSWDKVSEASRRRFLPVVARRNTLDGIDFIVEDRGKLLTAVRNAMAGNKQAFVEGNDHNWRNHWALTISFLSTNGVGFREIFRPKIIERPIENSKSVPFDSRLGRDVTVDVSALHIAVAEFPKFNHTRCNIHIDNLTVTLGGIGDDVQISPTVITHFVNELLFKTKLQGHLPDWIIDAFDISLLNPYEGFLNAGIGATIINRPNFKWTIKYSAGLSNGTQPEWSGNFKFEHSVGTSIVVNF